MSSAFLLTDFMTGMPFFFFSLSLFLSFKLSLALDLSLFSLLFSALSLLKLLPIPLLSPPSCP